MRQKAGRIVALLLCLLAAPFLRSQDRSSATPYTVCNQGSTLCVNAALSQSVVQNPLYFEVQVRCPDGVDLDWDLRDASGKLLDQDSDGSLAFLVSRASPSRRILAVRDFGLAPAASGHGTLVLHATAFSATRPNYPLPELSIPVRLDLRTTNVTYAVPADAHAFSQAIANSVESDPAHPVPVQAQIQWRTRTVLDTPPAMLGGAAAEAAARADPSQGTWHVAYYRTTATTAHIAISGEGWAGVSYYLAGLHYLLQKTAEHQPGVRRVVFDTSPDPGQ